MYAETRHKISINSTAPREGLQLLVFMAFCVMPIGGGCLWSKQHFDLSKSE